MTTSVTTRQFDSQALKSSFRKISWSHQGQVCEIVGTIIEAILPASQLGTIVNLESHSGRNILAEVVGLSLIHI